MRGHLNALGLRERIQFNAASALQNYIRGLAAHYAAGARLAAPDTDRTAFLARVSAQWSKLDPTQYPFLHRVAEQLPDHDDREQFIAGIDLILTGISSGGDRRAVRARRPTRPR